MIVLWDHTEPRSSMWNVTFSNVEGGYELTGPYPIQAVGTVQNVDFSFTAKRNSWEFETNDENGRLFPDEDKRAFQRRGRCEKEEEMPQRVAAKIIADCVTEFVSQITESGP
jgi:hypothetical protein